MPRPTKKAVKKVKAKSSASKAVKKVNANVEKTTLGDLDALSALKSDLEKRLEKVKKEK